jgi:prephenate dehydratase
LKAPWQARKGASAAERAGASESPARTGRLRVAFLGPEGTFTEEALFASAPRDRIDPIPKPTVYDCVMTVHSEEVDRAIVPIENSLEGSVNATLDALVFETQEVAIVGEVVHPVRHCLIARRSLAFDEIERVVSHPQASAQCARFIRDRLPKASVVSANSTADAVRLVAESGEAWAALGNQLSAEIYGCEVLEAGVEDIPENETRFVWLAREWMPKREGDRAWKTSLVFWGLPDVPGALVSVLKEFAERRVNLTKIESRPAKQKLGRYIFFADLEGDKAEEAVVSALDAVRAKVDTLRILGSYPAA